MSDVSGTSRPKKGGTAQSFVLAREQSGAGAVQTLHAVDCLKKAGPLLRIPSEEIFTLRTDVLRRRCECVRGG